MSIRRIQIKQLYEIGTNLFKQNPIQDTNIYKIQKFQRSTFIDIETINTNHIYLFKRFSTKNSTMNCIYCMFRRQIESSGNDQRLLFFQYLYWIQFFNFY